MEAIQCSLGSLKEAREKTFILIVRTVLNNEDVSNDLTNLMKDLSTLKFDVKMASIFDPVVQNKPELAKYIPLSYLESRNIQEDQWTRLVALLVYYRKIKNLSIVLLDKGSNINLLTDIFKWSVVFISAENIVYKSSFIDKHETIKRQQNLTSEISHFQCFFELKFERPTLLSVDTATALIMLKALTNKTKIMLIFGCYSLENNLTTVIRSYQIIMEHFKHLNMPHDFILIVCGTCQTKRESNYMKTLIETYSQFEENILFVKNVPQDILIHFMNTAICAMFPSERSIMEERFWLEQALHQKTAVIAAQCSTASEIIATNANGFISDIQEDILALYLKKVLVKSKLCYISKVKHILVFDKRNPQLTDDSEGFSQNDEERIRISLSVKQPHTTTYATNDENKVVNIPNKIEFQTNVSISNNPESESNADNDSSNSEHNCNINTCCSEISVLSDITECSSPANEDVPRCSSLIMSSETSVRKCYRIRSYSLPRNWRPNDQN